MPEDEVDPIVSGYYLLDGIPVRVREGRGPETWDGQPVDWTRWARRAVWITREEYLERVGALRSEPGAE